MQLTKEIIDEARRDYKFRLAVENRCETCSHLRLRRSGAPYYNADGDCKMLDIAIANVRTSCCGLYQGTLYDRRAVVQPAAGGAR